MAVTTYMDLEKTLQAGDRIRIDLGCGRKKRPGHIGIDQLDLPGVDIVGPLHEVLATFPDDSVDEVYSKSVFEHVVELEEVMRELMRVMKRGSKAWVYVPHWSSPYYYQDYTHVRFFGLYSFYQFADELHQHPCRSVPGFYQDIRIRVLKIRMERKSNFRLLRPFRKLMTHLINLSPLTQALYEENGTSLFPCYGMEVMFTPDK
ncbi:methyltransferase domain-containing protein [bacterium]|nr:methyltransferase domain-containing protein [bacterium]